MWISEINIYPVKSLKGIGLAESLVEKRGLQHDRRRMLTDPVGMFFTQREFPKMATISVTVNGSGIEVSSPGFSSLKIAGEPQTGKRQSVTVWQSVCEGEIYGDTVNEWFSDVLQTKCQLVYMPDTTRRSVNARFDLGNDVVSFADGYPLMVLSEATLADLNSRLDQPLPMNRFRPNLVVSGSEAFAEDEWQKIRIGNAVFRVVKPCERCVITTVDQTEGEFTGKEPLKTLASYRMAKMVMPERYESLGVGANAVLFGQNLIPESSGTSIRLGDPIEVLEMRS